MWTLIALISGAWACDTPSSAAQLQSAVSAAEVAFAQLDGEGFEAHAAKARDALPCVTKQLAPADAAAYHRLEALAAFLAGDRAKVVQQFQAVRSVQPTYELPQILAPPTHPLRADFNLASKMQSPMVTLPAPQIGALVIDGTPAREAPTARPYVFQQVLDDGKAHHTQAVSSGEPPPRYKSKERKKNLPLLAGGGIGLVASGILYGVASSNANQFHDPSTPRADLAGLRSSTNSLVYASAGVGVVGAGVLTWGVLGGSL